MFMRLFVCFLLILSFLPSIALADYFVWEDPDSGLTITFPDRWKTVHNQQPSTVLTIMGPSSEVRPLCTVSANPDRRSVIYPTEFGLPVQQTYLGHDFWEAYLGRYNTYNIAFVADGAGLGRWVAGHALASYEKQDGLLLEKRRSIMFATIYYNKRYIIECSVRSGGYEDWRFELQGIIRSIDFKKMYHERIGGYFRGFELPESENFWSQTGPEGTISY